MSTSGKCSMEVSRLIAEVHRRPELWDRQHPQHHNRSVLDHHWESVADLLGITGKAARSKWKNLKDHFRKEYKRCVTGANGDQEMSRWPYFYPMMFIREQISHTVANASAFLSGSHHRYRDVGARPEPDGAVGGVVEWVSSGGGPDDGDSSSPPRPRSRHDHPHDHPRGGGGGDDGDAYDNDDDGYRPLNCLHVEYGDWRATAEPRDDNMSDDEHFLLSLLPTFSALAPDKKLRARIAIETSLLNVAYPDLTVQGGGGPRPVGRPSLKSTSAAPETGTAAGGPPDDDAGGSAATTPDVDDSALASAAAVVTATATCTAVVKAGGGAKKRKSEHGRPQPQKKACAANARPRC